MFKYVNKRRSEGMEVFGIRTKKDNILVGTTGFINFENKIEYKKAKSLGLVKGDSSNTSHTVGFGLMISSNLMENSL